MNPERTDIQTVTSDNLDQFVADRLEEYGINQVGEPAEEIKAEEVEPKEEVKTEAKEEEKPKRKKGLEGRFQELTSERDSIAGERDQFKTEAEKLKEELENERKAKAELEKRLNPPPKELEEPQRDHFKTDDEFIDAKAEYKAQQKLKEKAWNDAQTKASQEIEDYNEVLGKTAVNVTDALARELKASELGPYLVYELAKNPDLATRLNGLSEKNMLKEFGKLEDRVEARLAAKKAETPLAEVKPEPKVEVSNAPPPIKPISAKSQPSTLFNEKGEFTGTPQQWRQYRQSGKV